MKTFSLNIKGRDKGRNLYGFNSNVLPLIKGQCFESNMWHKSYNQFETEPVERRTL